MLNREINIKIIYRDLKLLYKGEKGSVMVISLIILVLISISGTTLLYMSNISNSISAGQGKMLKSFYAAEAGLEYGLFKAKNSWDNLSSKTHKNVSDSLHDKHLNNNTSNFDLSIEDLNQNTKLIKSTGNFNEAKYSLTALLTREFVLNNENDFILDWADCIMAAKKLNVTDSGNYFAGDRCLIEENKELDLTQLANNTNVDSITHHGMTKISSKQINTDVLFVLDTEQESGDLVLQNIDFPYVDDPDPLIVIAEGKINLAGSNWSNIENRPLLLYSQVDGIAIEVTGENIEIFGSLMSSNGTIDIKSDSSISIWNEDLLNCPSLYRLDLDEYQKSERR